MKILPEHFTHIREAIRPHAPRLMPHYASVVQHKAAKNPAMRVRWDAMYAAGLSAWVCAHVYPYANDEHIDTALRAVMRDLDLPTLAD